MVFSSESLKSAHKWGQHLLMWVWAETCECKTREAQISTGLFRGGLFLALSPKPEVNTQQALPKHPDTTGSSVLRVTNYDIPQVSLQPWLRIKHAGAATQRSLKIKEKKGGGIVWRRIQQQLNDKLNECSLSGATYGWYLLPPSGTNADCTANKEEMTFPHDIEQVWLIRTFPEHGG